MPLAKIHVVEGRYDETRIAAKTIAVSPVPTPTTTQAGAPPGSSSSSHRQNCYPTVYPPGQLALAFRVELFVLTK
jgi:hypothetical protein